MRLKPTLLQLPRLCFALGLALIAAAASAADPDGPYVLLTEKRLEAWSVEVTAGEARKKALPVAANATITVAAVGRFPAFTVKLRPPATPDPDAISVTAQTPLLVVADTHGEFEILAEMLQRHEVVDAKLKWSFGRGHLVVLGDVFDRGPNHLEILWLVYELEQQARKAGGGVHLVLGNHEAMVLRGDLRYLHAKYRQAAEVLGVVSYEQLFNQRSVLGEWLRKKAVVLKVGELLCVHGGISRSLIDQKVSIAEINTTVRALLDDRLANEQARDRADFLTSNLGPLWYRGYFAAADDFSGATLADVDLSLAYFKVQRILVGHTTVPTIAPLYGGKVIAVQVYPRRDAAGRVEFESLLIRDGKLLRAKFDGGTEPL
jgi:hypothetical protein